MLLAGSAFPPAEARGEPAPTTALPGAPPAVSLGAPPADLALLIEEALAGHPGLKAASARVQAAQGLAAQAEAPPDPELSVAYLNDGVSSFTLGESEFSTLAFTWTQEVPYPGKRRGAGEVARQEIAVASLEQDRARLEIASRVKAAYADLVLLDTSGAILQETRGILDSLAQAAMRRYEVGEGIQENVLKSQTGLLRVDAQILRQRQDRKAAEARLNAAVGRATETPIGPATTLPEAASVPSPEALADAAVKGSPEIAVLDAAVRRQEAEARLARVDLKPDFLWSATYQNRGGLDPMVGAMFGVRLPVHKEHKQSQALHQAEAELEVARRQLDDRRLSTRASVLELASHAERAERLATLYDQGLIPQARAALESALASYSVGRIAFLDVLNDLTVLLESRIELASQQSERLRALAGLEPLVGMDLIPPSPTAPAGGSDAFTR